MAWESARESAHRHGDPAEQSAAPVRRTSRRRPPRHKSPVSAIKSFAMVGVGLVLVVSAQLRTGVVDGLVNAFSR